jgi:hypothetical protein
VREYWSLFFRKKCDNTERKPSLSSTSSSVTQYLREKFSKALSLLSAHSFFIYFNTFCLLFVKFILRFIITQELAYRGIPDRHTELPFTKKRMDPLPGYPSFFSCGICAAPRYLAE